MQLSWGAIVRIIKRLRGGQSLKAKLTCTESTDRRHWRVFREIHLPLRMSIVRRPRVAVIGAGIMGLPTAVLLTEAPYNPEVTIIAEKFSPDITSDVAGAVILPLDGPLGSRDPRRQEWNRQTYDYLHDLFASPVASKLNISLVQMYEMFDDEREESPWWKDHVFGFRSVPKDELKLLNLPVDKSCWTFTTMTTACRPYLLWQLEQFETNGGKVIQKKLNSLQEIDGDYDVIVNCTGLGSKELINDKLLNPVRGQCMLVKAPWIKHVFAYESLDSLTYIIPRGDVVAIGGTVGIGEWSEEVDPSVSKQIMERCCKFLPGLSTAEVVKEMVGLRPARSSVRLEIDETLTKLSTVVHNYGHGGQGVTFFRGCVLETVRLVDNCLQKKGIIITGYSEI